MSLTTTTPIATSPPHLNLAAVGNLTAADQGLVLKTLIVGTPYQVCARSSASRLFWILIAPRSHSSTIATVV